MSRYPRGTAAGDMEALHEEWGRFTQLFVRAVLASPLGRLIRWLVA